MPTTVLPDPDNAGGGSEHEYEPPRHCRGWLFYLSSDPSNTIAAQLKDEYEYQ